jgi:non-ribosomal peptide synthetase component F
VLDVLGRRDRQVKVRGTRVHLAEVETALLAAAGVREAAAIAEPDGSGQPRIAAFFVAQPGASVSIDELRVSLAGVLPSAAMPAAFVPLDEMPITAQGKLDRGRLAQLIVASPAAGHGRAPRTQAERAVAKIWQELLHVPCVSIDDDFIGVGGTSLTAMAVASRIRQEFGIALSFDAVLAAEQLESLASQIDTAREHNTERGAHDTHAG